MVGCAIVVTRSSHIRKTIKNDYMKSKFLGIIKESIVNNWDSPALKDLHGGHSYTYKQFAKEITKLHLLFQSLGIQKGDKIAICDKNSANWAVAFFASISYGAVVVTILNEFHISNIENIVNHSDSKILFLGDQAQAQINFNNIPNVKTIIHVDDFSLIKAEFEHAIELRNNIEQVFEQHYPKGFSKDDVYFVEEKPDDLAMLNYTSGTTSSPKGVMLPYRSLWSNTKFAIDNITFVGADDGIVCILPMAHMYGLAFEVLLPIAKGAHLHFLGRVPSPQIILGAFDAVNPPLVLTVPLILEKIIQTKVFPELKKFPLNLLCSFSLTKKNVYKKIAKKLIPLFGKNLREVIVGGAAMNKEVGEFLTEIEFPYTIGYGMTECGPLISYSDWNNYVQGSCGRIVDRMEIKIESNNPEKESGEILVRGTNLMLGYYKNEEATKETFTEDGWLKTGDLGIIDKKGNIYIKGRNKTMILGASGQNIYPEEIEDFYKNSPYVEEVLIVNRNHKLIALVYPNKDNLEKNEIKEDNYLATLKKEMIAINKKLPNYAKVTDVQIMDKEFEKTPKRSIKRFLYQN